MAEKIESQNGSSALQSDDAPWDPALFQNMQDIMEKEVEEMPRVASRRAFLQKLAAFSAVTPAAVLALASDDVSEGEDEFCLMCRSDTCKIGCKDCRVDTCYFAIRDPSCVPCMNCKDGLTICQTGRCDVYDRSETDENFGG